MNRRVCCLFTLLSLVAVGCDLNRKEKCEWYLVPEPDHVDLVEPGWVALCARNYVNNKQRCYLRATLEYAKAVHGKPFRFSTMKVREIGPYPREVESIKVCKPN
jgi:hypothetical protein